MRMTCSNEYLCYGRMPEKRLWAGAGAIRAGLKHDYKVAHFGVTQRHAVGEQIQRRA